MKQLPTMHWVSYYADDEIPLPGVEGQQLGSKRGYLSVKRKKGGAAVQRALALLVLHQARWPGGWRVWGWKG